MHRFFLKSKKSHESFNLHFSQRERERGELLCWNSKGEYYASLRKDLKSHESVNLAFIFERERERGRKERERAAVLE